MRFSAACIAGGNLNLTTLEAAGGLAAGQVFRRFLEDPDGGMDPASRDFLQPCLAGDKGRQFLAMVQGEENTVSPGLFEQVVEVVFGNRPADLPESFPEYILRGPVR